MLGRQAGTRPWKQHCGKGVYVYVMCERLLSIENENGLCRYGLELKR